LAFQVWPFNHQVFAMATRRKSLIPAARIVKAILTIRDENVMLDEDLAALYGVTTKVLNQAVRRNKKRFQGISCSSSARTKSKF
jgi:hypothetical protein